MSTNDQEINSSQDNNAPKQSVERKFDANGFEILPQHPWRIRPTVYVPLYHTEKGSIETWIAEALAISKKLWMGVVINVSQEDILRDGHSFDGKSKDISILPTDNIDTIRIRARIYKEPDQRAADARLGVD